MKNSKENLDLPMGFGMALAKNPEAMFAFSSMTRNQQQSVIDNTHNIASKKEMQAYVDSLTMK